MDTYKDEPKKTKNCAICEAPTKMGCSSCNSVAYCSVEHQKAGWKTHKKTCVAFKVKDDPTGSLFKMCSVATRDLKANTIVLDESPILQVPLDVDMFMFKPHCLTCGVDMISAGRCVAQYRCSKCSWPVCSYNCSKSPIHAENECSYFVDNQIRFSDNVMVVMSHPTALITHIRASNLKKQKPELWKKLVSIPIPTQSDPIIDDIKEFSYEEQDPGQGSSHHCIRIQHLPGGVAISKVENATGKKSTSKPKPSQKFSKKPKKVVKLESPYEKLSSLIQCQGYRLQGGGISEGTPGRSATYLFNTASNFGHECSPNCYWSVGGGPEFKIRIRTCVPVAKGEKLTVSRIIYLEDSIKGTRIRQQKIKSEMRLICKCKLCSDPTEFGTNMSAATCPTCFEECRKKGVVDVSEYGYLLPVNPLHQGSQSLGDSDESLWQCGKCGYRSIPSVEDMDRWDSIDCQITNLCSTFAISSGRAEELCRAVIRTFSGSKLHPNHYLFQCAYRLLCLCYVNKLKDGYPEEDCFQALRIGVYLMPIYDKILPGLNPFRAYLMRTTTNPNYALFYPGILNIGTLNEEQTQFHFNGFRDCLRTQTEAYEFYRDEPLFPHEENPRISDGLFVGLQKIKKHLVNLEARLTSFKMQKIHLRGGQGSAGDSEGGATATATATGMLTSKRNKKVRRNNMKSKSGATK